MNTTIANYSVLLIDDDAAWLEEAKEIFEDTDLAVLLASNQRMAAEVARLSSPLPLCRNQLSRNPLSRNPLSKKRLWGKSPDQRQDRLRLLLLSRQHP